MNSPLTHDALFDNVPDDGDYAIRIEHVSKRFALFTRPEDRLKQMVVPRLQRALLMKPTAYFKEFTAVNNVSLTVKRGETIGIIGRNGSGKSTLLQMIVGTLTPTSGTVKVKGRIAALLELGAGFNPEFTGRENVYVNGAILGFSREEMDARFEAIAAFAGIGDFIERPVKTYSSGMFVRLAFAVSTAVEPDILVVDEALSVGDEAFQRKCFARIEAIKERGGTILFVSHGAQTIVQLCDRAVLLDAGEKILEGEPKAVVSQYQRLINADAAQSIKIRSEITHLPPKGIDKNVPGQTALVSPEVELEHYFDPSLRTASETVYEQSGAFISSPQIRTLKGQLVNNLVRGRRYRYEYNVNFTNAAQDIGFGMLIKTTAGLELGGATTLYDRQKRLKSANAGTKISVCFEFECVFLPGTYFINAGVAGGVASDVVYLHRRLDALIFRVMAETDRTPTGLVDIKAIATWSDAGSIE